MPAHKRTPAQIRSDRVSIAKYYLEGRFQQEIADALKLSQQQVSYDIKAIQQYWQEKYEYQLDELRSQELARIDHLERTYWDAWEKSQMPKDITMTGKDGDRVKVAKRSEQRNGNPAYLSGVQWCIDRRCKLLGLDAPVKSQVNASLSISESDFDPEKMTTEELQAIANSSLN